MTGGRAPSVVAVVLVLAALWLTGSVLQPTAFALFIVVLAAPLQTRLRRVIPAGPALLTTIVVTLGVLGVLILTILWGIGEIGYWVVGNIGRFQASYARANFWLESHDIFLAGLLAQRFDVGWITGPLRAGAATAQSLMAFVMLAFVFIILGLKEADAMPGRIRRIQGPDAGWDAVATGRVVIGKFGRYMAVRGLASVLTGGATAALAAIIGVDQPLAWGVLAFAFNFLPFIGPLIVVALMTVFAAAQFADWQTPLLVLVTVSAAQFGIGSYLEPIMAGSALSISPFMVLVAVFFWGMLWGIPGAFLGVPIVILLVTLFEGSPHLRWLGFLLSGRDPPKG